MTAGIFPTAAELRGIAGPIVEDAANQLGAPVAFARGASTYDDTTGQWSGSGEGAAGQARRTQGDPERLAALGFNLVSPITLSIPATLLVPSTFVPIAGDSMTFAGVTYAVKDVDQFAPDGIPIYFTVTGSR